MNRITQLQLIAEICDKWSDDKVGGTQAMNQIIRTFTVAKREALEAKLARQENTEIDEEER